MLPDLRIVIAAVLSTFVLTVGVGFYASSRLINEPKKSTDSIAALDSTPVNRIALSWPAPTTQPEPLALDFAVTAKALRNPVRDITNEPSMTWQAPEPQTPPVRTTAVDLPARSAETAKSPDVAAPPQSQAATESPAAQAPIQPEQASNQSAPVPERPAPLPVLSDAPAPAPEPDIRVAVQYPPILELPPELRAPVVPVAPTVAAAEVPAETPVTTGSIAEPTKGTELDEDAPPSSGKETDTKVASVPEPADASTANDRLIESIPIPKPAPKLTPAKATAKKAAPKKVVRRPVRRAAPAAAAPVPNFFGMFTVQQQQQR